MINTVFKMAAEKLGLEAHETFAVAWALVLLAGGLVVGG